MLRNNATDDSLHTSFSDYLKYFTAAPDPARRASRPLPHFPERPDAGDSFLDGMVLYQMPSPVQWECTKFVLA